MKRSWQCQYVNSKGERCEATASLRLHFNQEHPFDFVNICEEHEREYKYVAWIQSLFLEKGGEE